MKQKTTATWVVGRGKRSRSFNLHGDFSPSPSFSPFFSHFLRTNKLDPIATGLKISVSRCRVHVQIQFSLYLSIANTHGTQQF